MAFEWWGEGDLLIIDANQDFILEIKKMEQQNKYSWYAVHTRSKGEKVAQHYFDKTGIIAYVPTIGKTKKYTRKIKHYNIPLITCYCFVKITPQHRIEVLKNPFVLQFLKIGDEICPIPEKEINILKKVTGTSNSIELIQANHFQLGDEVELTSGHLAGIRGFIVEVDGKKDLVIELTHIGFQLRLHVDPVHLRKVRKLVA